MLGIKVKEVLAKEADVIVNGDKPLMVIQLDHKASYPKGVSQKEVRELLDQEVKEVYIIKGLHKDKDIMRITV